MCKTTAKGLTWTIISEDLTTNNPEKLKQNESGGLTMDTTGAENTLLKQVEYAVNGTLEKTNTFFY